jgi:hypothetical protein
LVLVQFQPRHAERDRGGSRVVITFPTQGAFKEWQLTDEQIAEWQTLYPQIDVLAQCRMARAWVDANHKKTSRGMKKFLVGWLNRAVQRGDVVKVAVPQRYTIWSCPHVERCSHRSMCESATILGRPERQAS